MSAYPLISSKYGKTIGRGDKQLVVYSILFF